MFRNHELWRHRSCTEVDFYFVKIMYRGPLYIKAKVLYYNRHAKREENKILNPGYHPETVKIMRKDFPKWSPVVPT